MQVALIGGTFNPIHYAHLRCAEEIFTLFNLDKVIFIPSGNPPHKSSSGVIDAKFRLEMTKLATKSNLRFSVSDVEIRREGKSYTVDTIEHFLNGPESIEKLFFVMGTDSFVEISTWKDYDRLFSLCNMIIISRPGFDLENCKSQMSENLLSKFSIDVENNVWHHGSGNSVYFHKGTLMDISGSIIRKLIKRGESIRYLLPSEVEEFIEKNRLYR